MIKWLIVIGLVYFVYRYADVFKAIDRQRESHREIKEKDTSKTVNTSKVDESDYIDYEEVD